MVRYVTIGALVVVIGVLIWTRPPSSPSPRAAEAPERLRDPPPMRHERAGDTPPSHPGDSASAAGSWLDTIPLAGSSSFARSHMMEEVRRIFRELSERGGPQGDGLTPVAEPVDFPSDFKAFSYVRSVVVHPAQHPLGGFHIVLANATALGSAGDALDDGSVIIKLQYPVVKDEKGNLFPAAIESIFVMEKDTRRFPAEREGWSFEIFDFYDDARFVTSEEMQNWCFGCHLNKAQPNRVFSALDGGVRGVTIPRFAGDLIRERVLPAPGTGREYRGRPPTVRSLP